MTDTLTTQNWDLYTGRPRTITVRVGSRVAVRQWSGELTNGTVTGVYEEIKNERPGIDYTEDSGTERWAYLDQVESSR